MKRFLLTVIAVGNVPNVAINRYPGIAVILVLA